MPKPVIKKVIRNLLLSDKDYRGDMNKHLAVHDDAVFGDDSCHATKTVYTKTVYIKGIQV